VTRPEGKAGVLAGGLGLRLKRDFLNLTNAKTLFDVVPELRATSDMDFLLRMDLWAKKDEGTGEFPAKGFRAMLVELGYQDVINSWNFKKPYAGIDGKFVVLDLQARLPKSDDEGKTIEAEEGIKVKDNQVGRGMKVNLSGLVTPEAFAFEDSPIEFEIENGGGTASIQVPHPYAWLNLKVAAAQDWLLEIEGGKTPKKPLDNGDSRRLKHVTDVYIIVGMMTDEELTLAERLASKYVDLLIAKTIREGAKALFGTKESEGCLAIKAHNGGELSAHFDENYEVFWDALSRALGVGLAAAAPVIAADEEATADVEVKS
jgi:hypothetical protein